MPDPVKLVLIGESNPHGSDPRYALHDWPRNSAGGRLRRIVFGVAQTEYLVHDRFNLLAGDRWSIPRAREAAADIRRGLPGRVFVLLGAKVRDAFGFKLMPWFSITPLTLGGRIVILPHPSGLNRMWGKPDTVRRCREALREAAPGVVLGTL